MNLWCEGFNWQTELEWEWKFRFNFPVGRISCGKVVPGLLGQLTPEPISLLECRWKLDILTEHCRRASVSGCLRANRLHDMFTSSSRSILRSSAVIDGLPVSNLHVLIVKPNHHQGRSTTESDKSPVAPPRKSTSRAAPKTTSRCIIDVWADRLQPMPGLMHEHTRKTWCAVFLLLLLLFVVHLSRAFLWSCTAAPGPQLSAGGHSASAGCSVSNLMSIMVHACYLLQRPEAPWRTEMAAEQEDMEEIKAPHHHLQHYYIIKHVYYLFIFNNKGNNGIFIDLTSRAPVR